MKSLERGCYLGRTLEARSTESFLLLESEYASNARLDEHRHERPYLAFVLAGSYAEETRRGRVLLGAGASRLHEAGEVHSDRIGPAGARILNVELAPGVPAERLGPRAGRSERRGEPDPAVASRALRLHAELLCGDAGTLALEASAWELLDGLLAPDGGELPRLRPTWLTPVEERLRESGDLPSLGELARLAGIHPAHVARAFRRWTGCSVGEWHRARRVERAARELADGTRPLAEVALRHGFCDQSHFNRVFARIVGTSPGRYRSALRNRATIPEARADARPHPSLEPENNASAFGVGILSQPLREARRSRAGAAPDRA